MEKHLYQMPANCCTTHRYEDEDSMQRQYMWTDAPKGRLHLNQRVGIGKKLIRAKWAL